ncbi:Six-hairpin glycosidase [Thozetella sp. PMI_491]|nr:Six-hairpin glycosidase [Thozetella sp. PMI_491]
MLPVATWLSLALLPLSQGRAARERVQRLDYRAATYDDVSPEFISASDDVIALDSTSGSPAIQIFDYSHSVEGIPAFEVISADGDTSTFEITYGESSAALGVYMKLNLSSTGVLKLRNVGVRPTIDTTPITQLPGSFHSADGKLDAIWEVGARTIQMTEIPKDSTPEFWEVTSDGASVDSLAPQVVGSAAAAQLLNYNVDFKVKPVVGGFGFTVLSDTLNSGIYISCDVLNKRIAAYVGSTTLNQMLNEAQLPSNLTVALNSWHTVHATVAVTDISVSIDDIPVLQLSQTSRFFGSAGLGASFGQRAVFQNFSLATPSGDEIYSHAMTDSSFLPDFFMGTNPNAVVVDGSRRDRIAYTGDLDVAGGAALASTHNVESILGSLNLLGSYQATPGFFIPSVKIQQEPLANGIDVNITGLIGYSFNFLTAVASTYMHTGDAAFATAWAPKMKKMLDWADSQTLENGLFNLSDASFGGDWNYYDPPQSGIVTKFNVLYAYALQESLVVLADGGVDSTVYQGRLEKLREAIDTQLWSDDLNAYYISEGLKTAFAQDSNAIAILAGVNKNPSHSTETLLSTLSTDLMTPVGPHSFSSGAIAAGFQPYISPYASAYHLRAALAANASEASLELLHNLWGPMADTANVNYTGAFWETLDADGRPGFGLPTSLCHGWAAGPTAELTRYVLGVRPTEPGWKQFVVAPVTLGLEMANGTVPTQNGSINVTWSFSDTGLLHMEVDAPADTTGTVTLPTPLRVPAEQSNFTVNGQAVTGPTFQVNGGTNFILTQVLKAGV